MLELLIPASLRGLFCSLLVLGLFFSRPALGADRLSRPLDASVTNVLPGSVHPRARPEADAGPLDGSKVIESATLVFSLSPAQQGDLAALLRDQADPISPNYKRWLTPEEYADRFGMTDGDLARVSTWLHSAGFQVDGVSRARTRLSFTGTVAQLNAAFHTEMHRFNSGGEVHFANATPLSLPSDLFGIVSAVENLNDFRPRARVIAAPRLTSQLSGNHFLTPDDFAAIYDVAPLYAAGIDGTGQTIAIVGQALIQTSDIAAFRSAAGLSAYGAGLSAPTLTMTIVSGSGTAIYDPTNDSNDITESCLDIEWAGGVAKNANIVFVYTGNNPAYSAFDSLTYAIDQNVAPVISTSYGVCESQFGTSSAIAQLRQLIQQANTQGQTVVAASGDSGAADCENSGDAEATQGLAVDLPAGVPEVTGVGGTEFTGDAEDTLPPVGTSYWAATNNSSNGSAKSYIPETVWNDSVVEGGLAASGGGASSVFPKPSWQTGAGVPADGKRDVPDIAFTASPVHDAFLICSQGFCTGDPSDTTANDGQGFRNAQGGLEPIGGTSCAAPSFAGILALVSEYVHATGFGNANPTLYTLASTHPAAFHSITTGSNIVPCQPGTPNCPTAAPYQYGYSATGGYSQAAGLGSLDAWVIAQAWPGAANSDLLTVDVTGSGSGTVTGGGISCTTGSSPGCTANESAGGTATLTAAAASGSSFAGWSGAGCSGTGTCTVTMSAAETVTASFTANAVTTFALAVTDQGTGTGTVTSSPAGISCGPTCSFSFASGTSVTLTATPSSGSTFTGWSGACSGLTNCTVSITSSASVIADFTAEAQPSSGGSSGGCQTGGADGWVGILGLLAFLGRRYGSRRSQERPRMTI